MSERLQGCKSPTKRANWGFIVSCYLLQGHKSKLPVRSPPSTEALSNKWNSQVTCSKALLCLPNFWSMNVVDADNAGKNWRTRVKGRSKGHRFHYLLELEPMWCRSCEDNEHVLLFILRWLCLKAGERVGWSVGERERKNKWAEDEQEAVKTVTVLQWDHTSSDTIHSWTSLAFIVMMHTCKLLAGCATALLCRLNPTLLIQLLTDKKQTGLKNINDCIPFLGF